MGSRDADCKKRTFFENISEGSNMDPNTYRIVEPVAELRPFIRRLFVADSPVDINQTSYPAPTGYNYIGWIFDGDSKVRIDKANVISPQRDKLHVAGQIQYHEIEIVSSGQFGHILAECTATGFFELTGIPGERVCASCLSLAAFDSQLTAQIDSVLAATNDLPDSCDRATHRLAIFQEQLSTLISGAVSVPNYVSQAVNLIEAVDGGIQVADLAQQLEVSPRQLRRKFKEIVGITPKYFAKVLQMNRSLLALYSQDLETLTSLAQDAGFYDQAHFINVMQQFFGQSPQEFLDSSEPILATFLGKSRSRSNETVLPQK